jgi:hypothetical protein
MDAEAQKLLEDTQSDDEQSSDSNPGHVARYVARRREKWIIVVLLVVIAASNASWLWGLSQQSRSTRTQHAYCKWKSQASVRRKLR